MKALLFFPSKYSIAESIRETLEYGGAEVKLLDYRTTLSKFDSQINIQIFRLPDKIRLKWEVYFFNMINRWFCEQVNIFKPDLVFVYNNEMLLPSSLEWLKSKGVKLAFYLGDNPLYSPTSRHNLAVLEYADAVYVPDSFWQEQLMKTGIPEVHQYMITIPEKWYYPLENNMISKLDQTDILYVGISYHDSWGYKKAKYLNSFTGMNFKLYGNKTWKRWFRYFPALENHFTETNSIIPVEELNLMYNCSRILPVDGNPGLMHGLHIRITEAIGSGILPLMEWQHDIFRIFGDLAEEISVKNYHEAREKSIQLLSDEVNRMRIVRTLREIYSCNYNHRSNLALLTKTLRIN